MRFGGAEHVRLSGGRLRPQDDVASGLVGAEGLGLRCFCAGLGWI